MLVGVESERSSIELVVGPYRTGKTRKLLEHLIDKARSSAFADLMVVVPSARYGALLEERLYELLESRKTGQSSGRAVGVFGLRVVPFYRLCRTILESAGQAVKVVPDPVRPALVGQVIDELLAEGDLRSLSSIARLPGTSAAVLELVDEFQRAGFSPYEVRAKLEETAFEESRYLELARIYDRYWAALDAIGYFDRRRLAFAAREILFQQMATTDASGEPAVTPILPMDFLGVDGFDRVGRLQTQVLLGLSRRAKRTQVIFDYPAEEHTSEQLDEYLWKKSSFEELIKTLRPAIANSEPKPATVVQLSFLDLVPTAKAGMSVSWKAIPAREAPADRRIFSTLDRFLEMQEIARSCKAAMVRAGSQPGGLLVVARNLNAYRGAIEAAFDEADLPYFIDESVSLPELPLAQFVITMLRLAIDDFPRSGVLTLLRSPYLNLGELGLRASDVDAIDDRSWTEKLVRGRPQWDAAFDEPAWSRVQAGLTRLFDLLTPRSASGTLTAYLTWAEDVFDQLLRLPSESSACDNVFDDGDQVLSSIRDIVRSLVIEDAILSSRTMSFEAFIGRFKAVVDAGNFRRRKQWKKCITICGADLAPNKMYDEVFIAGMIEGEFPRRSGQSGFVGREELLRWAGFGIDIHNPRDHPGFEQALFASLVSRARRRVHLSFPLHEMDGEEVVPSFFIAEEFALSESKQEVPLAASLVEPVSPRDAFLARLWHDPACDPAMILTDYPGAEFLRVRIEAPLAMARGRVSGARDSVYNGCLTDLVRAGTLGVELPERWSASRLNYYGQCPFKYWVSYALKIRPRPEPEAGVGRDMLGSAYHRAMELFYSRLVDVGLNIAVISADVCQELLVACANEALCELEADPRVSLGEFWEYEKREFHFRLRRFVAEEAHRARTDADGFQPSRFEVQFGGNEPADHPPLVVRTSRGPVVLTGRVDRIDLAGPESERFVRVVDYKTGSRHIKADDAESGRSLQLPIYALAAERVILPGSRVTKGVYLSINSGEAVGRLDFAGAGLQDLRRGTEDLISAFVESIGSGDFTVRPTNAEVCDACDHKNVCRVAEITPEDRPDE